LIRVIKAKNAAIWLDSGTASAGSKWKRQGDSDGKATIEWHVLFTPGLRDPHRPLLIWRSDTKMPSPMLAQKEQNMQSIDNTQKYTRLRCLPLRPARPACCAPCLGFTMALKSA
jgi:hypothetical protein